jgi:hypothetical protein
LHLYRQRLQETQAKPEIKQNFIDQHPPVGSIDSKTGKPVTKIEPMLLKSN